jgi:plastocyanin
MKVPGKFGRCVAVVVLFAFAMQAYPQKGGGTTTLEGRLELVAGSGQSVRSGEVSDGVVYFLPKSGAQPAKPGRFSINTRAKGFSPAVLAVPLGSTVAFPNSDAIMHNVYSRSPSNPFDFGFYGAGQVREHTFDRAGLVLVNCNVHQTMRANILVLATQYYARPGRDGRFRIPGVPAGPGTLVFWHPRGAPVSLEIDAPARPPTQRIAVTKPPLSGDQHQGHSQ